MNLIPDKATFSPDEHAAIRAECRQLEGEGLKQAEMARQAEVGAPTLNQYLGSKYPGDNDAVAAKLHKWLKARRVAESLRQRFPVAPSFVPLMGSGQIMTRLHYARNAGRIVSICGQPGVSKTSTALQYRHTTPRTWMAAMEPATRGVNTCLVAILEAMGDPEAKGTPQALARRLLTRAVEAPCLIIVDEAQELSDQSVEQLRAINDKARALGAKVGIALMGNLLAHSRVAHDGSRPAFAQVSSRMAQRMWIVAPDPADVDAFAEAYAAENGEVLTDKARLYCREIASKPGGLRNVEMAMESALMAAWGADQPLDIEHLRWAFNGLSGLATGLGRAA